MTEKELRQKVVSIAKGWLGLKESDGSHKKIIDIYNAHKPLAVGYKVKYTDAWCATTVSAAFIKAGLADIAPTECSCPRMVELYKKKGRWQEKDSYIPAPGDIVMYDWQDSGTGDNKGNPDHVGIVASISGTTIKVIEGNINNAVGYRTLKVNGKYIRGYCLPDFAAKATKEPAQIKPEPTKTKPDPARSFDAVYARTYTVTASALNMRLGPSTTKGVIKTLKNGEKVTCYGYFTKNGSTTWLFVQDSEGTIGFCSQKYLRTTS